MEKFSVGQTVRIAGKTMTDSVGTVIQLDTAHDRYLVRVGGVTQNYFAPDELENY